jgi:RNA polymerase sigma-70 factor (ECF subfamily)
MGAAAFDFFFGHWAGGDDSASPHIPYTPEASSSDPGMLSPADAEQSQQLREGNGDALEAMFHEYAAALEQYARRLTEADDLARDVVQDVFVWLWETRAQFAPRTSVRAYLFGAVRHRALDAFRRERVRRAYTSAAQASSESLHAATPSELLEHDELRAVITNALATLTPRVREVAELRWMGRLSYREIAAMLNISERTVNTQLVTATQRVRAQLEGYWKGR